MPKIATEQKEKRKKKRKYTKNYQQESCRRSKGV